jgi:hypothetical protein
MLRNAAQMLDPTRYVLLLAAVGELANTEQNTCDDIRNNELVPVGKGDKATSPCCDFDRVRANSTLGTALLRTPSSRKWYARFRPVSGASLIPRTPS